jgi:hypothetical protein
MVIRDPGYHYGTYGNAIALEVSNSIAGPIFALDSLKLDFPAVRERLSYTPLPLSHFLCSPSLHQVNPICRAVEGVRRDFMFLMTSHSSLSTTISMCSVLP